jgi:hypothetical protein
MWSSLFRSGPVIDPAIAESCGHGQSSNGANRF